MPINSDSFKNPGGRPKLATRSAPPKTPTAAASTDKYDAIVYGYSLAQWQEILGQEPSILAIELAIYQWHIQKRLPKDWAKLGMPPRWQCMKNAFIEYMRITDPTWEYARNWYVGMDWMLWGFCDEVELVKSKFNLRDKNGVCVLTNFAEVAVPAASNMSKTWFMSRIFALHFISNPADTIIYLTTTDASSLGVKLWGDLKKFILSCPSIAAQFELKDSMQDRSFVYGNNEKSAIYAWAVARGDRAVGRFSGGRNKHVLVLTDEAPQTPKAIFDAATGNLRMGVEFYKFMMLGNLGDGDNEFSSWCKPPGGFGEQPPLQPLFLSERGNLVIHLDSMQCNPNYLMLPDLTRLLEIPTEKQPCLFLQNRENMESILRSDGENSDKWWRWVRGWPPPNELAFRLIPRSAINRGFNKEPFDLIEDIHKGAFLDVAYGGGDRCVFLPYTIGLAILPIRNAANNLFESRKVPVIQLGTPHNLKIKSDPNLPEAYQIVNQTLALIKQYDIDPRYFGIDATGGDVYAIFQKEYSNLIEPVFVNLNKPTDRKFRLSDLQTASEQVDRFVTELWVAAGIWLQEGQLRGLSEAAAGELGARIFEQRGAKKCAEEKREMKRRMKFSPDEGDAVTGVIEVIRRKGYQAGAQLTGGQPAVIGADPWVLLRRASNAMWEPNFGV